MKIVCTYLTCNFVLFTTAVKVYMRIMFYVDLIDCCSFKIFMKVTIVIIFIVVYIFIFFISALLYIYIYNYIIYI